MCVCIQIDARYSADPTRKTQLDLLRLNSAAERRQESLTLSLLSSRSSWCFSFVQAISWLRKWFSSSSFWSFSLCPTQTHLNSPCSKPFRQDWVADNASMRFMHAKHFWGGRTSESEVSQAANKKGASDYSKISQLLPPWMRCKGRYLLG